MISVGCPAAVHVLKIVCMVNSSLHLYSRLTIIQSYFTFLVSLPVPQGSQYLISWPLPQLLSLAVSVLFFLSFSYLHVVQSTVLGSRTVLEAGLLCNTCTQEVKMVGNTLPQLLSNFHCLHNFSTNNEDFSIKTEKHQFQQFA